MKTILVSGGCGFIGSNLCSYLLQNKNKVICVDNLFSSDISGFLFVGSSSGNDLYTNLDLELVSLIIV